MSWLTNWYDKVSGRDQMVDTGDLGDSYDAAFDEVTKGYSALKKKAEGMMDPYSQENRRQLAMMENQASDQAAESARLAQRNAAMAGGAPAGAMAAQTMGAANKAQAGVVDSFNKYLQGQSGAGASMLSGVLANQGQIANQRFNMIQSQEQANRQIDRNASLFGTNLLGKGLGMAGSYLNPVGGALGLFGGAGGNQRGGYIELQDGGSAHDAIDREKLKTEEDFIKSEIKSSLLKYFGEGALKGGLGTGALIAGAHKISGEDIDRSKLGAPIAGGALGWGIMNMLKNSQYSREDAREKYIDYLKNEGVNPDDYLDNQEGYQKGGEVEGLPTMKDELLIKALSEARSGGANAELYDALSGVGKGELKSRLLERGGISGYQQGGEIEGGMLSLVQGPKGPMRIGTRMGGQKIG